MKKSLLLQDFKSQIDRKLLLTVQEAATLLGVSEHRIREQIDLGELKVTLLAGWTEPKIYRKNVDELLERRSYYKEHIIDQEQAKCLI